MELFCINGFNKDKPCCKGQRGESLFNGLKIVDGARTFYYSFPLDLWISKKKLVIIENNKEVHYRLSDFSQSYATLKDIISSCSNGQYQNRLLRKYVIYEVDNGAQNLFLCPKESNEVYLNIDHYDVYLNGQLCSQGTDENQFILSGGDVFFTQAIPDETPNDLNFIEIYYFVKY